MKNALVTAIIEVKEPVSDHEKASLSSQKPTLKLLIPFEGLAEAAERSGNYREYVTQAVTLFGIARLSGVVQEDIVQRLERSESAYRQRSDSGTTEADVAETFNGLARSIMSTSTVAEVDANDIHVLRVLLAGYGPHVFLVTDNRCSPIEAGLLLLIAMTNNGKIQGGAVPFRDSSVVGGVRPRTTGPSLLEAVSDRLSNLKPNGREAWLAKILKQLHV